MVAARIRTHILMTRSSEHKSDALNRSTMALHTVFTVAYCLCLYVLLSKRPSLTQAKYGESINHTQAQSTV